LRVEGCADDARANQSVVRACWVQGLGSNVYGLVLAGFRVWGLMFRDSPVHSAGLMLFMVQG